MLFVSEILVVKGSTNVELWINPEHRGVLRTGFIEPP